MFTYGDASKCYSIYIRYDCHEKLHPRVFGILLSASPAVSALAGWLILDERLNSFQVLGITIIMASCAGCSYFSYKRNKV